MCCWSSTYDAEYEDNARTRSSVESLYKSERYGPNVFLKSLSLMCRMAYRKAISTIRSLDRKVEKVEDVDNLPTIGKKIKEKIKEILLTGGLRKADALEVI